MLGSGLELCVHSSIRRKMIPSTHTHTGATTARFRLVTLDDDSTVGCAGKHQLTVTM